MFGKVFAPAEPTLEVVNGIAAGALAINGAAIDGVPAATDHGGLATRLVQHINEKTAQHGVRATVLQTPMGLQYISPGHAGGAAIEVTTDPLVDGGISTFFDNGTVTAPPGSYPGVATATSPAFDATTALSVPSRHPTGVLGAGSFTINGVAIGAVDFTSDQTAGGLVTALVQAINAKTVEHTVEADIEKNGDQWSLRLFSMLGKSFSFTVDPDQFNFTADADLDEWTRRLLFTNAVPNGYTVTVPSQTPPPVPAPGFTAADLDAEVKLEGQFTITSSSNTLTDVLQGVTLNLRTAGNVTVNVERDIAGVQSSAQAIAKSCSDLVATLGRLGGTALRGERSTLGGIERELRAVLNTRVNVDSDFSNAFETGFSTQKSGALSLDTTTFGKALAQDYAGLARLFADPNQGIAKRLFELADSYLDTGALLDGRNAGLARQVREAEVRRAATEQRLKLVEGHLLKQYNTLDLVVNRLQGKNSALGSQLDAITGFYRQNRA